ncbi:hypothetical protein KBW71_00430 [Hydrogenophaga aromaticivorans]|uniref:DUF6750 family protein n=1 Tax=Hydrogenophaga aromaticivorans TaxID=2610898 RepID=UPI001B38FDE1|nr:DUF6750 family protein [Hydrogenophaga aromaticivorans]MBQ0916916.1 hypothetical protein [Hydrogenophaga aromaticivorans]
MKTVFRFFPLWRAKLSVAIHEVAMLPARLHAIVFLLSMSAASHVHAAGVTGFFEGWTEAIKALGNLLLQGGMVVGIGSVLYGLVMLVKKGLGRGDDIEWRQVMWPLIGGALASILLYVIQAVVEESGASKDDMGRTL